MQILKDATLYFTWSTPRIAMVIPAMDHLDSYLATSTINPEYSAPMQAALAMAKQTLNCYYNRTDHSEVYHITMGMLPLNSQCGSLNLVLNSIASEIQAQLLLQGQLGARLD